MNTNLEISAFVEQKTLVIVGLSRDPKSFSVQVLHELLQRGYTIYAINPNCCILHGIPCYAQFKELPELVETALFMTPPSATESSVRESIQYGVRHIWLQQGAESPEAETLLGSSGLCAITRKCILMYAEPVKGIHAFHRFFCRLVGHC